MSHVICQFILSDGSLFLHLCISSPVWRQSDCHTRRKEEQGGSLLVLLCSLAGVTHLHVYKDI